MDNNKKVNNISLLLLRYITAIFAGAFFFSTIVDIYLEVAIASLVVIIVLLLPSFFKKRIVKLIINGIIVALIITCFIFLYDSIIGSFGLMLNKIIDLLNSGLDLGILHVAYKKAGYFLTNIIVIFTTFYLIFNALMFILNKSALAYFFLVLFLLVILTAFGIYGNIYSVALYIGVAFIFLITDGYQRLKLRFFILTYCILIAFVLLLIIPSISFTGSKTIDTLKYYTNNLVDNILYNSGNEVSGDLTNAKIMRQSDEDMLTITTNQGIQSLYLKGFVGGNFENNRWQEISNSTYSTDDNAGILDYLMDYNLPYTSPYQYDRLNNNSYSYSFTVNLLNASKKRYYYPYFISSTIGNSLYHEAEMRKDLFTPNTYSFSVSKQDVSFEATKQESWVLSPLNDNQTIYLNAMSNYQNLVYNNYLNISDEDSNLIKAYLNLSSDSLGIYAVAIALRHYFTQNYTYNTGDKLDRINDSFLSSFYKKEIVNANSVYFSTAAVYAFRAYGIPARYVEGYLYSNTSSATDEYYTLTGDNQHAWVEVYFDGIGWLPIELTPGFYVLSQGGGGGTGTTVTPPNPSKPEDPDITNPIPGPNDPVGPNNPNDPNIENQDNIPLFKALSFSAVGVLLFIAVILSFYYGHEYSLYRRKRRMQANNEQLVRYIYSYYKKLSRYCSLLEKKENDKFISIIEKGIFSNSKLDYNDEAFIKNYIEVLIINIKKNNNAFIRFYLKFIIFLI